MRTAACIAGGDVMAAMTTHQCPVDGCLVMVSAALLMCARHWRMVPESLRAEVWATWADGSGAGSLAHLQALAGSRPVRR